MSVAQNSSIQKSWYQLEKNRWICGSYLSMSRLFIRRIPLQICIKEPLDPASLSKLIDSALRQLYEIKQLLNTKYVCAPEATHHNSQFPISFRNIAVALSTFCIKDDLQKSSAWQPRKQRFVVGHVFRIAQGSWKVCASTFLEYTTGCQLSILLNTLFLFETIDNAEKRWNKFIKHLFDDFVKKRHIPLEAKSFAPMEPMNEDIWKWISRSQSPGVVKIETSTKARKT